MKKHVKEVGGSESDAEAIYREYRSHGLEGWGPFIHYDDPQRHARFLREIEKLLPPQLFDFQNSTTIALPSAWHAVLFFIRLESIFKYASPPMHHLYRGQADPYWELVSTFDRLALGDRNREWTASTIATGYFARRLYMPRLHIASYSALSRHMGFASKQMDWSVDPAVAVHFACEASGSATQGKVYMLTVPKAVQLGLEVWCPVPCCERIYGQLGVFLRPGKNLVGELNANCPCVVFPKPTDVPFVVMRDGEEVDVLKAHTWLLKSTEWIREKSYEVPNAVDEDGSIMPLIDEAINAIEPPPKEFTLTKIEDRVQWAMRVLDLYHWLFVFMSPDGSARLVPPDLASPIIGCNRALTEMIVEAIDIFRKFHPEVELHDLDKCLAVIMGELGPLADEENDFFGVLRDG